MVKWIPVVVSCLLILLCPSCSSARTSADVVLVEDELEQSGSDAQESNLGQEVTVPGGNVGISIGQPQEGATVDSEGYPHNAVFFSLWGGTARVEDANGDLVPIPPGTILGQNLIILNGNDHARTFHLLIMATGRLHSDRWGEFDALPEEYWDWIRIEDLEPKVPVGGTKKMLVTISIPNKLPSEMRGGRYWFGIQVEDWSQTGFIQIAPKMNWLLTFVE